MDRCAGSRVPREKELEQKIHTDLGLLKCRLPEPSAWSILRANTSP